MTIICSNETQNSNAPTAHVERVQVCKQPIKYVQSFPGKTIPPLCQAEESLQPVFNH